MPASEALFVLWVASTACILYMLHMMVVEPSDLALSSTRLGLLRVETVVVVNH